MEMQCVDPEHPFEYFFLDQKFDEQYRYDLIQNKLLSVLSNVCVFILLLRLLGLSAFSAVQRTKEIGVRKVLGANVSGILIMLSKDVVLLVLIAAFVAAPLSWWMIDEWLSAFAYRARVNILLLDFDRIAFVCGSDNGVSIFKNSADKSGIVVEV